MSKKILCPISKDILETEYQNLSPTQIGEKYNVSRTLVLRWLKEFCLPIRNHSNASILVGKNQLGKQRFTKIIPHKMLSNYEWLYDQRINQKKSKESIAELVDCSTQIVNNYLQKFNIITDRVDLINSDTRNQLNKEVLEELYNKGFTLREIAKQFNVSLGVIFPLFQKFDIKRKKSNEYERKFIKISKFHDEIVEYIKSICDKNILVNHRKTFGFEVDIFIPECNLAIECNGLLWHSEDYGKDRWYHYNKSKVCEEKNVFLFHVWEDDWKNNKDIIKSMISNKIGIKNHIYFARNTEVKNVSKEESIIFLNENHIQKYTHSEISLGLYYNRELLSIMMFNNSRFNNSYKYELVRFCSKKYINVIGGFSKLLSNFRKNNKEKIITYSDNCYSNGNVYKVNNFKLLKSNLPDYFYYNNKVLKKFNKRLFRKKLIASKFNVDMTNLTESKAMKNLGYRKIWNAGMKVWILE
jgi:predicted DNA-binding protein YlxM (UPF0122 family)